MAEEVLKVTAANGVPFSVRFIHHDDKSLVEFYDARYDNERFTPGLGQFVSRYYAATLLGQDGWSSRKPDTGLNLHGGVADWCIDGTTMEEVTAWIGERAAPEPAEPKPG